MIARGDRHHDIAAWFGVNQGRIAEVQSGDLHPSAPQAPPNELPPAGPYSSGQAAYKAITALQVAKKALEDALKDIDRALKEVRK
jgi:hypothetical protein